MTDKAYPYETNPIWLISRAYLKMKKYEGIPEFHVPGFRIGLAGRLRDLMRMWGNMDWKGDD